MSSRLFRLLLAGLLLGGCLSPSAHSQLIFYSTRSAFNAACPGLPIEDFEKARVPAIGIAVIANPLDKTTNNSVYLTGEILDGLRVSSSSSHSGQELGIVAPGTFGNASKLPYNNFGGDSLNLTFYNNNVTCVGSDILDPLSNAGPLTLSIFGLGGVELGTSNVIASQRGTFFGVSSTNVITRINILSTSSIKFAGADNVAFGASSGNGVPEPGSAALITSLGVTGGAFAIRRHMRRKN